MVRLFAVGMLRRRVLWMVFAVLSLWVLGTRWHLRLEPLERDIATYAVIGREMLAGRQLYSDLWDHKPPGIHLIFAGATAVVGAGVPAVLLVNVAISVAILGVMMLTGRRLAGDIGGIVAGVLWVFVGLDLGLQANQPNVELPMNLLTALALLVFLVPGSHSTGYMGGVLTAAAMLLKPVAAAQFGLLAAVEVGERWQHHQPDTAMKFLGRWLAATLLILGVVMGWLVLRSGFDAVWGAVVRYNMAYASGTVAHKFVELVKIGNHLPASSLVVLGLLAACAVGALSIMEQHQRRLIVALLIGTTVAISAPGKFYPHYFQLLLPILVVAATVGLTHGLRSGGLRRAGAVAAVVILVAVEAQTLRLSPDEWSRRKYGETFLDERRLGVELEAYVEPGQPFWQLGTLPGLYLLTETVPASGVLYDGPLRELSPVRKQLSRRVKAELTDSAPRWLVIRAGRDDREVMPWLRQRYRLVAPTESVRRMSLWVRRDSPPTESHQSPVFSDGFESGNTAEWTRPGSQSIRASLGSQAEESGHRSCESVEFPPPGSSTDSQP